MQYKRVASIAMQVFNKQRNQTHLSEDIYRDKVCSSKMVCTGIVSQAHDLLFPVPRAHLSLCLSIIIYHFNTAQSMHVTFTQVYCQMPNRQLRIVCRFHSLRYMGCFTTTQTPITQMVDFCLQGSGELECFSE